MNLRHPIEFLANKKKSPVDEDIWEICYSTFADISHLNPNHLGLVENFNFGHLITTSLFIATIRWSNEITMNMRVKFDSKIFEIKKIIDDFDNKKFKKFIILEI